MHAITQPLDRPAGTTPLRLDLLGPVQVLSGGAVVSLTPLELNLVVLLALTPGIAVSTERLIDQLWGDHPPAGPRCRVQGLVSGLRRKVGDVVMTRYPGYLVDRDRLERDVDVCERLVASARCAASVDERARLLAAAQETWRGEPLVGISTPGVVPERARLTEQRLALLEARAEVELELGRHRAATDLLAPAVEEHPFRERLAGLHMTALYRGNRQADALAVYHRLRERLADELGSDVCAEVRELYTQILRGEGMPAVVPAVASEPAPASYDVAVASPGVVRPAQLPARDGLFVGRSAELATLDAVAPGAVAVVSGPGGLGKTSLVVEWAHRARGLFPDGQLFLEVGDQSPAELVGAALLALGTPAADLPDGAAERTGLYRTLVRDRRLLVVADGARTVEQVLALVPSGPESRLVATTRTRMVSLAAHHAVRELTPGPLDHLDGADVLGRIVGPARLAEPAAEALVGWCGGWPLLLRHVGARLAARPSQPLATFVADLELGATEPVLDGDPRSVDAALASVHDGLTAPAARLFERLALHSGVICLHLAAVTAGTSVHRVRLLLDELTDAHLLVEAGSGEFAMHSVVGRFGRRLACAEEWTPPTWGNPSDAGCLECCQPVAPRVAVTV